MESHYNFPSFLSVLKERKEVYYVIVSIALLKQLFNIKEKSNLAKQKSGGEEFEPVSKDAGLTFLAAEKNRNR